MVTDFCKETWEQFLVLAAFIWLTDSLCFSWEDAQEACSAADFLVASVALTFDLSGSGLQWTSSWLDFENSRRGQAASVRFYPRVCWFAPQIERHLKFSYFQLWYWRYFGRCCVFNAVFTVSINFAWLLFCFSMYQTWVCFPSLTKNLSQHIPAPGVFLKYSSSQHHGSGKEDPSNIGFLSNFG